MVFVSLSPVYLCCYRPDTLVFSFLCDYAESTVPAASYVFPFCGLNSTTTFVYVLFAALVCVCVHGLMVCYLIAAV